MLTISMPAEAAGMPDPGDALIERVTGTTSREFFYWSGRQSVHELKRTLAVADRPLESFESILDFGCGCGRVELWLAELSETLALHGTDIDDEAIAWARANIPQAQFTVNSPDPPLPFDEGAFDLVFNHSVFTHIDAERQDQWLSELHRVIRPGGMAVLSVHGERVSLKDPWAGFRDQLEREGIVFLDDSLPADSPFPEWYQATLHAPWYIFEHWGQWFDIRALIPGGGLGHDHVLLERTSDTRPRHTLAARPAERDSPARVPEIRARLDRARRAHADAASYPSRFGRAGGLARQAVLRLMRPYTAHEANVDSVVIDAVQELARRVTEHGRRIDAVERDRTPRSSG